MRKTSHAAVLVWVRLCISPHMACPAYLMFVHMYIPAAGAVATVIHSPQYMTQLSEDVSVWVVGWAHYAASALPNECPVKQEERKTYGSKTTPCVFEGSAIHFFRDGTLDPGCYPHQCNRAWQAALVAPVPTRPMHHM